MDAIVTLLMERFGFSKQSAELYAQRYIASAPGSWGDVVAGDVPRRVANISAAGRTAAMAQDERSRAFAEGVPGTIAGISSAGRTAAMAQDARSRAFAENVPNDLASITDKGLKRSEVTTSTRDAVAEGLIPGRMSNMPQPITGPLQAFTLGKSGVLGEYAKPGMRDDLSTAVIDNNLFYAFKSPYPEHQPGDAERARQDWERARSSREMREKVDAVLGKRK